MGLDTRLKIARLLYVTDGRTPSKDLGAHAAAVFAAGADIVELNDPALRSKAEIAALTTLRDEALKKQKIVAAYADAELAGEFGADMLVLRDDGSSAAQARRRLHPWALVGRACRSHADTDAALADPDVAFLIVPADLDNVRYAAAKAPQGDPAAKPWFAAGGITVDYVEALVKAGCRRVVVSRAIAKAKDPAASTAEFAEALKAAWDADPAMEKVVLNAFKSGKLATPATTSGSGGSGAQQSDAPDAGDGFGPLTNPFKNAKIPPNPPGAPTLPDPGTAQDQVPSNVAPQVPPQGPSNGQPKGPSPL